MSNKSWKPEVRVAHDPKWYGNATRFASKTEAEAYARDLESRWTAVEDARVIESDDPVNSGWFNGRTVWLEEVK